MTGERAAPAHWRRLEWPPWSIALEPVGASDAALVTRALTDEIARWIGFETVERLAAGTPAWAAEAAELARDGHAFRYLVEREGRFAGTIELRPDAVRGHIGYWLRRPERGRGTATLANRLLLPLAFEALALPAVDWVADARNSASIAVFGRLGATKVAEYPASGVGGRESEVRYRLARRAFVQTEGGPCSVDELLSSIPRSRRRRRARS